MAPSNSNHHPPHLRLVGDDELFPFVRAGAPDVPVEATGERDAAVSAARRIRAEVLLHLLGTLVERAAHPSCHLDACIGIAVEADRLAWEVLCLDVAPADGSWSLELTALRIRSDLRDRAVGRLQDELDLAYTSVEDASEVRLVAVELDKADAYLQAFALGSNGSISWRSGWLVFPTAVENFALYSTFSHCPVDLGPMIERDPVGHAGRVASVLDEGCDISQAHAVTTEQINRMFERLDM